MAIDDFVGLAAAAATSFSYLPQVKNALPRGATSTCLGALVLLTFGLLLWILHGFIRGDTTVLCANILGAALSGTALCLSCATCAQPRQSPPATGPRH